MRLHRLAIAAATMAKLRAGDPHPSEPESLRAAEEVHKSAMSRWALTHGSMPARSGPHGITDKEADAFDTAVKEVEGAVAYALRQAEAQVRVRVCVYRAHLFALCCYNS